MSSHPLRVAVVGCGRIARVHCRYLKANALAELAAVCDPVEEAAAAVAKDFAVPRTYRDLDRMLTELQPDAVHVLTPPATHAAVALQVLDAGAHVLIEKPMAVNAGEADRMVAAAARAGRTLCVDHNRWFDPVVQRARALVASGALGDLVGAEAVQGAAVEEVQAIASGRTQNWRADLPGGVMHDLAPHPVYLLRNSLGPLRDLRAVSFHDGRTLQEVRAVVEGTRGLGSLTLSMQARPTMNSLRLIGTQQSADINLNNMTLVVRREPSGGKLASKVLPNVIEAGQLLVSTLRNGIEFATGRQRYYPGMGVVIDHFYRHLVHGTPPPTTPEEGRDVVRILDQLWEATALPVPQRRSA